MTETEPTPENCPLPPHAHDGMYTYLTPRWLEWTVAFIGSYIYVVDPLLVEVLKKDLEQWLILEEVCNLGWVLRFERLVPSPVSLSASCPWIEM